MSPSDVDQLKEFALFQLMRTVEARNKTIEDMIALLSECAILENHKRQLGFNDDELIVGCKSVLEKESTAAYNISLARKAMRCITDLNVVVVHYKTDNKLIISDTPVIMLNPFSELLSYGLENVGIVLMMPLSPEYLLILLDPLLYESKDSNIIVESYDCEEVKNINRYELIRAERTAYSSDRNNLIVDEELLEKRKDEQRRKTPMKWGLEGHRLIISQSSGIKYYYELPYFKLHHDFKRIPISCRNSFSRVYDSKWEERIINNYKIYKDIYYQTKDEKFRPTKEMKVGYKLMEKAARVYWKRHKELEKQIEEGEKLIIE